MSDGFFLQIGIDQASLDAVRQTVKEITEELSRAVIELKPQVETAGIENTKTVIDETAASAGMLGDAMESATGKASAGIDEFGQEIEEADDLIEDFAIESELARSNMEALGLSAKKTGSEITASSDTSVTAIGGIQGALQGILSIFAAIKATDYFSKIITAANAQEDAIVRLNAALSASGSFTETLTAELQDFASQMQTLTGVADDAVLGIIAQMKNLGVPTESLKGMAEAAINMAAALGMDATSAATMLAKALQGNSAMLGRYGIQLDSARIKTEGASYVIAEMSKFQGLAAKQSETFSGRLKSLNNVFGDLLETIGFLFTKNELFTDLIKTLTEIIRGIDLWVSANKDLTAAILYTAVAIGGTITALVALKGAFAMGTAIKAGIAALSVYQAGLAGTAVQAGVAKAAIGGMSASTIAATGGLLAVAAAFAAIFLETQRLNAEAESYIAKEKQEAEKLRQMNEDGMRKRADILGEILAKEGEINKQSLLYRTALQQAVSSRHTEGELLSMIYAKQREINDQVKINREENKKDFDSRLEQLRSLEISLQRVGNVTREQMKMQFGEFLNESAIQKFYAQLYNISAEMERAGETAKEKWEFDKIVDDANAAIDSLLQTLPQVGGELKNQGELVSTLISNFTGLRRSEDEILQSLQEQTKQYAQIVKTEFDAGRMTVERAAAEFKIIAATDAKLRNAAKEENLANKRALLLKTEEGFRKQFLTLQEQSLRNQEQEQILQDEIIEKEKRRVAAISEIPEIQAQILDAQDKSRSDDQKSLDAINRKWTAEIAAAKARKESAEYIYLLELKFTQERVAAETKIGEIRRKAAEDLANQIAQNNKDIDNYVAGVEEKIRRLRGEGAIVDLEKEAGRARELIGKVESEDQGKKLRDAAQKGLEAERADAQAEWRDITAKLAERRKAMDALKDQYEKERAAIMEDAGKISRKELAKRIDDLNTRYADEVAARKAEIAALEEQKLQNQQLQDQMIAKQKEQLALMDAELEQRYKELEERKARAEAEKLKEQEIQEAGQPTAELPSPTQPAEVSPVPSITEQAQAIVEKMSGTDSLLSIVSDALDNVLDAQESLNTAVDNFARTTTERLQIHEREIHVLENSIKGYAESLKNLDSEGLAQ